MIAAGKSLATVKLATLKAEMARLEKFISADKIVRDQYVLSRFGLLKRAPRSRRWRHVSWMPSLLRRAERPFRQSAKLLTGMCST